MTGTPAYIGLLNAIAVGEARGARLLDAWLGATRDADVASVLRRVAVRSHEHAASFTKRLLELGFAVNETPLGDFAAKLAAVEAPRSDREKFEILFGFESPPVASDRLADLFADRDIDPETGALLGRYIAEERDSERALRACYDALGRNAPGAETIEQINARIARLSASIEELKALRGR
jgi:hypothetical protein